MEHEAFVERVMTHLPSASPGKFEFAHWSHAGRPTDEGFGVLPIAGADPEKIAAAVLDVDHYVGNIDYVSVCRSVKSKASAACRVANTPALNRRPRAPAWRRHCGKHCSD